MNRYMNIGYVNRPVKKKKKKPTKLLFALAVVLIAVIVGVVVIGAANKNEPPEITPESMTPDYEMTAAGSTAGINDASPESGDAADVHKVTFSFFGKEDIVCLTKDTTLGELIENADITIGETSRLNGDLDRPITEDTEIVVDEVGEASLEIWDEIPYETEYIYVGTIPRGQYQLVQSGVKGIKYEIYNRELLNGEEISRQLVYETVYQYPQKEIYYVGSGGTIYKNGEAISYSYYIDMTATYYTRASSPSDWGYLTYTGRPVDEYCIAVDPSVIPLNTWVYVENPATGTADGMARGAVDYGKRIAADIGGGIKNNHIDIYIEDDSRVDPYFHWYGVINVRVYILD